MGLFTTMRVRGESSSQRGSAILEFAMSMPLLMTMITGVVEVSNAVNQYLTVSRIAYDGARYAANLAGLEEGSFASTSTSVPEMQSRVQRRVSSLLQEYRLGSIGALETSFDKSTAGRVNTVHVRIQVQSLPIFFTSFGGVNMEVNATGPYLFTVE